MADLDNLVIEQLVPFRERILTVLKEKHPYLVSMLEMFIGNRENRIGMQVLSDGEVVGEYTFSLKGIHISHTESGRLESELHHPLMGVIRPYVQLERSVIERILADEEAFRTDIFAALAEILPDLTIRFLSK